MNKNLFSNQKKIQSCDSVNNAGGNAFSLSNEEALAQLACTGTFNGTYYASGVDTLKDVLKLSLI